MDSSIPEISDNSVKRRGGGGGGGRKRRKGRRG
jgi:hypothetical protein